MMGNSIRKYIHRHIRNIQLYAKVKVRAFQGLKAGRVP